MTEYYTLGTWDSYGVPNYLDGIEDIEPTLMTRISQVVPERNNVPKNNPSYFENPEKNLLIQSTDPEFVGADVYVTFLYEGAGYRNTVGYFVYPLVDEYTVPTKKVALVDVPMAYTDRNLVDARGKSLLKKTIIFPNASLPTWANSNGANSQAGGGKLLPGSRVKLLYDTSDPSKKFPNNVGIGFFLIPNGWNGSTFTNANERIYSYNPFNALSSNQTIIFNDLENTDAENGSFVVAFEDIMLPGGDGDFNDILIKVSYTPSYCNSNLSKALTLGASEVVEEDGLVADKVGFYYRITKNTLNIYNNKNIKLIHRIYIRNNHEHRNTLYKLFTLMTLANNGQATMNDEEEYIEIEYTCNKGSLQNYIYFFNNFANRDKTSPINPYVSALVEFQNLYVRNDGDSIFDQNLRIIDRDDDSELRNTKSITPNIAGFSDPYAMGDPHIFNIYGEKFDLDGRVDQIINLYSDKQIQIRAKIGKFFRNDGVQDLNDLVFIEYLYLTKDSTTFVFNMFHKDTVYELKDNNMIPVSNVTAVIEKFAGSGIELLSENDVRSIPKFATKSSSRRALYEKIVGSSQFEMQYVSFTTHSLGQVFIELVFMPHRTDFVNSVGIHADGILMHEGCGIWVDRIGIKQH